MLIYILFHTDAISAFEIKNINNNNINLFISYNYFENLMSNLLFLRYNIKI